MSGQVMNALANESDIIARKLLLQRELERCLALLIQDRPPHKVILFGSLAEDKVDAWSDLDLVIVDDTDLPFLERTKAVLQRVRPRVGMDVLVYTPAEFAIFCQTRRFFREEILKKGKIVYADALPGSLPDGLPGRQEAEDALDTARQVLQWSESVLGQV